MRVSGPHEVLQEQIDAAVRALRNGGVVAIPTDTLYGLAASAFDPDAVDAVFRLKGRPSGVALPLLLADGGDLRRCCREVPELAWALVERFWPGALTLVLKRSAHVPDAVTGGGETVAVRVPDHPVPRAIAEALGTPITGTSANRSGGPELATPQSVREEFGHDVALVVDAGGPPRGVASTVLDLSSGSPRILRQGAIPRADIQEACGRLDIS